MNYLTSLVTYLPNFSFDLSSEDPSLDPLSQRIAACIPESVKNAAYTRYLYVKDTGIEWALRAGANIATVGFNYSDFKQEKTRELKEITKNEEIIDILSFLSGKIAYVVQEKASAASDEKLNPHFKNIIKVEKNLICEAVHANLLHCAITIAKKIKAHRPAGDVNSITISDILVFFTNKIQKSSPDFSSKMAELGKIADKKKRSKKLKKYLAPITGSLLKVAFPKDGDDIVGLKMLTCKLYDFIKDTVLLDNISPVIDDLFIKNANNIETGKKKIQDKLGKIIVGKQKKGEKPIEMKRKKEESKTLIKLIDSSAALISKGIKGRIQDYIQQNAGDIAKKIRLESTDKASCTIKLFEKNSTSIVENIEEELTFIDSKIDKFKNFTIFEKYGKKYGFCDNGKIIPFEDIPTTAEKNELKQKIVDIRKKLKGVNEKKQKISSVVEKDLCEFLKLLHKNLIKNSLDIEEDLLLDDQFLFLLNDDMINAKKNRALQSIATDVLASDSVVSNFVWEKIDEQVELLVFTTLANIFKNQKKYLPVEDMDHPESLFGASFLIDLVKKIDENVDSKKLKNIDSLSSEKKRKLFQPIAKELFTNLTQVDIENNLPAMDLLRQFGLESSLRDILTMVKTEMLPDFIADTYKEISGWKRKKEDYKTKLKDIYGTNYANEAARVLAKYAEDFLKNWLKTSDDAADLIYDLMLTFAESNKNAIFKALLQSEKKRIIYFLSNNFESLSENDDNPEIKMIFEFFNDYLECAFLKIFCGLSKPLKNADPDVVLQDILKAMSNHFSKVNEIRSVHDLDDCFKLDDQTVLSEFGEALHKGVAVHTKFSPEIEQVHHEDFQGFVKALLKAAGVDSDNVSLPSFLKDPVWKALSENLLPKIFINIFDNMNDNFIKDKMLLNIIKTLESTLNSSESDESDDTFRTQKDELYASLKNHFKKDLKKKILKKITDLIIAFTQLEKEKEIKKHLKLFENKIKKFNLTDAQKKELGAIRKYCARKADPKLPKVNMDGLKDVKICIHEMFKQQKINIEVGKCILAMINILPNTISAAVINHFRSIHKNSSAAIGRSIRKYFKKEKVAGIIDLAIKNGIESFADASFKGVPHSATIKVDTFTFPNTDAEKKAEQDKKRKENINVRKDFISRFSNFLKKQSENIFNDSCDAKWKDFNKRVDVLLDEIRLFGIIPAIKWLIQHILEYVVVKIIVTGLQTIFHPFYIFGWFLFSELHLKNQAGRILRNAHMNIHQNFLLHLRDFIMKDVFAA